MEVHVENLGKMKTEKEKETGPVCWVMLAAGGLAASGMKHAPGMACKDASSQVLMT